MSIWGRCVHRWADVRAAARALERRPEDARLIGLLTRTPFLPPRAAAALTGQRCLQGVHRRVARLRAEGLVGAVRPAFRPHGAPRVPYLTDPGLATAAHVGRVDPDEMVARLGLGRDALYRLMPCLEPLLHAYALLGLVAGGRPGDPGLLAWERPWRHRFVPSTAKAPVTVLLPGYAELAWDGGRPVGFFLVPDPGTVSLRAYRPPLVRLLQLRHRHPHGFPLLVVLVWQEERAAAWRELLLTTARERGDAPLAACVGRWRALKRQLLACLPAAAPLTRSFAGPRSTPRPEPPRDRQPGRQLPRWVGDALDAPPDGPVSDAERLGRLALGLTERDRFVLGEIGRHPFLPIDGLAARLGVRPSAARWRRRALVERGLVRVLAEDEVHALLACGRAEAPAAEVVARIAARELAEVTADGFALAAEAEGLRPRPAVRHRGLGGGGPDAPLGTRRQLAKDLEHTLVGYDVFIRLDLLAARRAAAGGDDELTTWESARACARRGCSPDGYGVYRRDGRAYGFLLEFDRCRMFKRDLAQKLNAYHDFFEDELRQAIRTYPQFPAVLFVVSHESPRRRACAEKRIAAAARAAAARRGRVLPVYVARADLIWHASNPDELLGPVWLGPAGARCSWIDR